MLAEELRRIYSGGGWAYDELYARSGAVLLRGRVPVVAATLGGLPVIAKRLTHGGVFSRLTGDRFLTPKRWRAALAAADFLREHGVDTPEPLFAAWRRGGPFVRGELGFRRVVGAVDASDHLFGGAEVLPGGWREAAGAIGRTVARLHALGVVHGDLNLMNFLLPAGGKVMILDLDKARLTGKPLAEGARRRNLARLERSVRKQGRLAPAEHVGGVLVALRHGYEAARA
jgi:hypothetical protein